MTGPVRDAPGRPSSCPDPHICRSRVQVGKLLVGHNSATTRSETCRFTSRTQTMSTFAPYLQGPYRAPRIAVLHRGVPRMIRSTHAVRAAALAGAAALVLAAC